MQPHLRTIVLGSLTPNHLGHLELDSSLESWIFFLISLTVALKKVEFLHYNERKHKGF